MQPTFLSAALGFAITTAGAAARAELYCPQPVHQAGQVHNGLPLSHQFTFVNRGTAPVEITEVRPTCGCLTPQLAKRIFAPGEEGTLLLEVNTLSLAEGTQSWRTTLHYREGNTTGGLDLVIVGDVVTDVLVLPAALTLPADVPGVREITVTDRRPKALTVRAADAGSPCLRAVIGPAGRDGGVSVQKVRLEVPADCPEGRHDVALHLYTDDPEYSDIKVPVTVVKTPHRAVSAAPSRVTMEGDRGRPVPPRLVLLAAADGAPVEVAGVEADDPAVHCEWVNGTGKATVRVRIDHARLTGDVNTTVRVRLLKPAAETLTIPVSCVLR